MGHRPDRTSAISAIAIAAAALATAGGAQAATLVASYGFDDTLASSVGGPALSAVDPSGTSGLVTDTVGGVSRTVYHVGGTNAPTNQGGLVFDAAGLLNNVDGYSVAGSDANILANTYRNIVLTVQGSDIRAYIDSGPSLLASSTVLDLQGANLISLFLDNTQAGGQGEWSTANIATANFLSDVLTADEAATFKGEAIILTEPGAVPEPATWALMLVGFGFAGAALRGRRSGLAHSVA